MSKIYMAVTVCQDKNETTLPREHTRNAAPVITLMFCHARPGKTSNLRLIASADWQSPTFAAPKKRRRSLVTAWNDAYKANGEYLFDSPAF